MLVSMRDIVRDAWNDGYVVGGFDTWNLDSLLSVVRAADRTRSPVIVLTGPYGLGNDKEGIEYYSAMAKIAARRVSVPVAVLLNEAPNLELIRCAVDHGFTGLMFEQPGVSYDERVKATQAVTKLASRNGIGIGVEGQVDDLNEGPPELEEDVEKSDPSLAGQFARETGIDILSVAVGNVHCNPEGSVSLDLELLAKLQQEVRMPLALHGGSSVPDDMLREAAKLGVAKMNIGGILRERYAAALRKGLEDGPADSPLENYLFVEEVSRKGMKALEDLAADKMCALGSAGRAD